MTFIINPYFTAGAPAYNPNDDSAHLWLRGDDADFSGLSSGDPIGGSPVWINRATAIGGTWSRGTPSERPVYRPSGSNGKPFVEFASGKELNGFSESNYVSVSAYHAFFVVRPDGANGTVYGGGDTNLYAESSVFKWKHYLGSGNFATVAWGSTFSTGTWYLIEVSLGSGTLSIKVNNGTAVTLGSVANNANLGNTVALQNPFGLSEVITFVTTLSGGVAASYVTALQAKYAL